MAKKKKKNIITIQAKPALQFGTHEFFPFGDELIYTNKDLGKKIPKDEWNRDVEFNNNIYFLDWKKKAGREAVSVTVETTVKKLKKLVQIAERDGKKFAKADKKAGRELVGYFKHFGNVSFFFTGKP